MTLSRAEAERRLQQIFGLEKFYDEQWQVIERLLRGERCLLIERTGFGKSLCYQFTATQLDGLTIIFSPLIALMRDQVRALREKKIAADYINSERAQEENAQTIQNAIDGKLKILYIAPERQENREWQDAVRQMHISLIVVDEAHTISVWGHDFRPSFRRIVDVVARQPKSMPILATTATATLRTQQDIEQQLGGLFPLRGDLRRDNLRLFVVKTQSEDEKMMCIAHYLKQLQGSGLIYTGTRADTEKYAKWLSFIGFSVVAYNAGMDEQTRKEIEQGLMANRWKCVVSTNALGMGIDKSDIRFIIHTQIPASPIHYYQEIGRAGRDGEKANIILFFNEAINNGEKEDLQLPKAFINQARPAESVYQKVIELLKKEPLTERQIVKAANIRSTQVRIIKADLLDQGIVREVMYGRQKVYEYQYNAPMLNFVQFEKLRQAKLQELQAIENYVYTQEPRMKYLCKFLDSVNESEPYENCDNTTFPKLPIVNSQYYRDKLTSFYENELFPLLELANEKYHLTDGVAASYYGISGIGQMIHKSKYEGGGDFPPYLVGITLRAMRKFYGNKHFDYIVFVPPTVSGPLVEHFAMSISELTHIPLLNAIVKTRPTEEQKQFQNAFNKKDNVTDAFAVTTDVRDKTLLLIDDIYDSGATLKEIGKVLAMAGAKEICPLVIAKTLGSDNL